MGEALEFEVAVERGLSMVTRDGVTLWSDVYRPVGRGDCPTLLYRGFSPRAKLAGAPACQAARTASRGYNVVVQEARGRCDSEGDYEPFVHEADDGHDAVQWAAQIAGSNGTVGTYGQSYSGTVQYLTAATRPSALKAMVPVWGAPSARKNFCYSGDGGLELANLMTYTAFHAPDTLQRAGADPDQLADLLAEKVPEWPLVSLTEEALSTLPLDRLVERFAVGAPFLADQLDHEADGPYWYGEDLSRRFGETDVPTLHIGSWYDNHLYDTIAMYVGMRRFARSAWARDNQRLVIAPFAHTSLFGGPNHGSAGELDFGNDAQTDVWALQMDWFDHFLTDPDVPRAPHGGARVFVLGANSWREHEAWPPADVVPTALHLHSAGAANSSSGDGTLEWTAPGDERPDVFVYDPGDPVPSLGGRFQGRSAGPVDQRPASARTDVLVYTSPALEDPVEIGGQVLAHLHASSSAVDTDFVATLVDVHPDGYEQLLADGIVRARFRDSATESAPLRPGEVASYTIDLWHLAHTFRRGHRVRVEISSSSFPRWARNLNTGGPLRHEHVPIVAEQQVHHSTAYPSRLILPLRTQRTAVSAPAVVITHAAHGSEATDA